MEILTFSSSVLGNFIIVGAISFKKFINLVHIVWKVDSAIPNNDAAARRVHLFPANL